MPLPKAYSYGVPAGMAVTIGDFVEVPFGARLVRGVVWTGQPDEQLAPDKIKMIERKFDFPGLVPEIIDFITWVADYTLTPLGLVLRMVMRKGSFLDTPKPITAYLANPDFLAQKLTPQRRAVLEALKGANRPLSAAELARRAKVSAGVVTAFVKKGGLRAIQASADQEFERPNIKRKSARLSTEQTQAARQLSESVRQPTYTCTLLDGVTGAGKTEVYLEAVSAALKQDKTAQILILLPEIALTVPFLRRLEERFGAAPAYWHSDMGDAARRRVWRRVGDGSCRLVIGARSALFLPFQKLRLIIIDEEHEGVYKQQDGVLYHARDMAVLRASHGQFPIILVSATPALETLINAEVGRYKTVRLQNRYGGASMPTIELIDMKAQPPEKRQWLSPVLRKAVTQTIGRGEQALLFLNRRGYAPLTICRKCGERMTAPDSDSWLVEHRFTGRLVCHHTGFSMPIPQTCPHCGAADALAPCGPGVERVAEEATALWPDYHIEVFSSDTVRSAAEGQALLRRMADKEIDILVATQIAAKGHHFPALTLVGVVDADLGLTGGDLRAAERSWQMLGQVAGRAGRADKPGRALLQTWQPDHPVMTGLASGAREQFMNAEKQGRAMMGLPPYGRLASILLSDENEQRLNAVAAQATARVPHIDGAEVWGPSPAPLYRLRGRYRIRFLVKTRRNISIQNFIRQWLADFKLPSSLRLRVDVDPYGFL